MNIRHKIILTAVVLAAMSTQCQAICAPGTDSTPGFTTTPKTEATEALDGGITSVDSHVWNFSDWASETLTATKTYDNLEVLAASGKTITIDASNKSYDGLKFTKRLKLGGTGSSTSRHLHFKVAGPCTITVYGSSSNTTTRTLNVDTGSFGHTVAQLTTVDLGKVVYEYTGTTQTDIYVYSPNSGFNIYGIVVASDEAEESSDFPLMKDITDSGL